tara:strand:+ start:36 stop:716 length:681 start_codon:yes stop_codon:yes gene_type:complete
MVKLGLGFSLASIKPMGAWSPTDETKLEAWYKKGAGIVLNGSDVSTWRDQSSNSRDMVQATASEQPAYDASGEYLDFVAADKQNLQTTSQMSLPANFTIGIKFYAGAYNNVLVGDNTTANEFFKLTSDTRLAVKIDGTTRNLDLDSGTFGNGYIVVTRSSNTLTLWHNGVEQSTGSGTLAGTSDIDAIGVRKTDVNAYQGKMYEIQIFAASNPTLTANVNNHLSKL